MTTILEKGEALIGQVERALGELPALRESVAPYLAQLAEFVELRRFQECLRAPYTQKSAVDGLIQEVCKVVSAFEAGFEPCSPPTHWYCGTLDRWQAGGSVTGWFPSEHHLPDPTKVREFQKVLPLPVLKKWATARDVFGDQIVVYSPDEADFQIVGLHCDPVMIGRLEYEGNILFFEIARWDTARDLQAVLRAQDANV